MKEYKFEAFIKSSQTGKGGAYIEFPFDVEKEFKVKGRVPVICYFENIRYKGSLVKMGTDCHIIGITKDIRGKLNKEINDSVNVRLYKDETERTVEPNEVLKKLLDKNQPMKEKYGRLSYTRKKEINILLDSAKKEETFKARLNKIIEELKN